MRTAGCVIWPRWWLPAEAEMDGSWHFVHDGAVASIALAMYFVYIYKYTRHMCLVHLLCACRVVNSGRSLRNGIKNRMATAAAEVLNT